MSKYDVNLFVFQDKHYVNRLRILHHSLKKTNKQINLFYLEIKILLEAYQLIIVEDYL